MELYQLKSFLAVAETGRLAAAAERVHASQPALSAHVKALEDELGVPLFTRTPRGMLLTPAGARLATHARSMLGLADAMRSEAASLRGAMPRELRLGLNTDSRYLRILDLKAAISRLCPDLGLEFIRSSSPEVLRGVREGRFDAGFVYAADDPSADLARLTLERFGLIVVGPAAWRAEVEAATVDGLADFPWVLPPEYCPFHTGFHELFAAREFAPRTTVVTDAEEMYVDLVAAGAGMCFMRPQDAEEALARGDVCAWPGPRPEVATQAVCLALRREEPALRLLWAALDAVWGVAREEGTVSEQV